jgi:hypothetical protein
VALFICWEFGHRYEINSRDNIYDDNAIDNVDNFNKTFPYLEITELDTRTEPKNAVEITLDENKSEIVIDKEGDYILSGIMTGHIIIDAKEQNVHLFLNNVTLKSEGGPAIIVPDNSADKLVITVMDGTGNAIVDNGDFRHFKDYDAAIDASCDITINGTGALIVNGYYKDAIHSKDIVKVLDGTYSIASKKNAIRGNDGILISGGNLMIESETNGLMTSKKGSDGRGNIVIDGGTHSIIAGRYSLVTTKADIYVYNCSIYDKSIVATYDCAGENFIQEGCVQ